MSRKRSEFYNTIEYIGPRPQKPKRPNVFGGWVIVVIALGIATWFGRPLVPFLKAAGETVTTEQTALLIGSLGDSQVAGERIAAAALAHSLEPVVFDNDYIKIPFPGGDISPGKGNASDVLVRSFRRSGIDLQKEVHEDMSENFRAYPQLFGRSAADSNIDHRLVSNLQRFFERKAQVLEATRNPADYLPGDVVVWSLANAETHIGIVVPGPDNNPAEPWVVHHMPDNRLKWENVLMDFKIQSHFRYPKTANE